VGISVAGYRREWVECAACGAATSRQDPVNAERLEALASGYYEVDFAGRSVREKFDMVMSLPPERSDNAGRVERVLDAADRIQRGLRCAASAERRVLDIGAGTGVFLARFCARATERGARWTAVALEPDPQAAAHLLSLQRFDVVQAVFEGQAELCGFDLVTLNKVIEHIADPVEFLKRVALAADPDCGVVYVEVPDVLTIGRRSDTDNILGALHHHLYTPASLGLLFDRAGLRALEISRVFEPSGKMTVFGFGAHERLVDALAGIHR